MSSSETQLTTGLDRTLEVDESSGPGASPSLGETSAPTHGHLFVPERKSNNNKSEDILVRREKIETWKDWLIYQIVTTNVSNVGLLIAMLIVSSSIQSTLNEQKAANAEASRLLTRLETEVNQKTRDLDSATAVATALLASTQALAAPVSALNATQANLLASAVTLNSTFVVMRSLAAQIDSDIKFATNVTQKLIGFENSLRNLSSNISTVQGNVDTLQNDTTRNNSVLVMTLESLKTTAQSNFTSLSTKISDFSISFSTSVTSLQGNISKTMNNAMFLNGGDSSTYTPAQINTATGVTLKFNTITFNTGNSYMSWNTATSVGTLRSDATIARTFYLVGNLRTFITSPDSQNRVGFAFYEVKSGGSVVPLTGISGTATSGNSGYMSIMPATAFVSLAPGAASMNFSLILDSFSASSSATVYDLSHAIAVTLV